jgi:hypothetical protein
MGRTFFLLFADRASAFVNIWKNANKFKLKMNVLCASEQAKENVEASAYAFITIK